MICCYHLLVAWFCSYDFDMVSLMILMWLRSQTMSKPHVKYNPDSDHIQIVTKPHRNRNPKFKAHYKHIFSHPIGPISYFLSLASRDFDVRIYHQDDPGARHPWATTWSTSPQYSRQVAWHGNATDATDATDLTTVTEGSAPGESGSCYALDDQARFRTSRTCLASFL